MVSICGGVDQYYPWAACVIAGTIHQSINNMIDCWSLYNQTNLSVPLHANIYQPTV